MPERTVFRTIREQIADHIRNEILARQLPEGEALREQDLARRFGVSRGPVRDALLQLTQEGLLVGKPNCGVTVSCPPTDAIQSLVVDLRRRIEVFTLRKAFGRIGQEQVSQLDAIAARLHDACKRSDMSAVVEHDMAFHRTIVEWAGDANLLAIWLPIVSRMMLRYARHADLMDSYREHAAILQAIRDGRRREAVAALKQNIQ